MKFKWRLMVLITFITHQPVFGYDTFPTLDTTDQYGKLLNRESLFNNNKKHLIAISMTRKGFERAKKVTTVIQGSYLHKKVSIVMIPNLSSVPRFMEGSAKRSLQWNNAPPVWLDWEHKSARWSVPPGTDYVWIYVIDKENNIIAKIDATRKFSLDDLLMVH